MTPEEAAWLAVVPCTLLMVAAIALLGPPLRAVLLPPSGIRFFPGLTFHPEDVEQARFLIALLAPLLLSAAVVLLSRRRALPRASVVVRIVQWALLAFVPLMIVMQHVSARDRGGLEGRVYFDGPTLVASVAIAGLIAAFLMSGEPFERVRTAMRETPRRRQISLGLAALILFIWMLTAFNTEGSLGRVDVAVTDNFPYWIDEVFAVFDGMYPLVDFHTQYGQLLPFLAAGVMAIFGTTIGVYTATMASLTFAAMLAMFATLRRVLGNSLVTLTLFIPFVWFSFFKEQGTFDNRYGPSNLFSLFPIRYAGPFVMAWLVMRHVDGARPHSRRLLFLIAGIFAIHNLDMGMAALGATAATLVWTAGRPTLRSLGRLAGDVAIGAIGAVAAVSLLTLVIAGSLPHFDLLSEFPRIYGRGGFSMEPMPTLGFHLVIYVTFIAAVAIATVRALRGESDRLMTGMLCWIGIFGLGAGGYYAGRSHHEVLIDIFSPWAIAIVLLLVLAARAIRARPARRPNPAELAVMFCFGLMVCALTQTPAPWAQVSRISESTATPIVRPVAAARFIDRRTDPGERVAILVPLGHRIAYELDIDNAYPYAHLGSVQALHQWDVILRILREQHIQKIYYPTVLIIQSQLDLLTGAGYAPSEVDYEAKVVELTLGGS